MVVVEVLVEGTVEMGAGLVMVIVEVVVVLVECGAVVMVVGTVEEVLGLVMVIGEVEAGGEILVGVVEV